MTLERWSPLAEMRRMEDVFNRLWRGNAPIAAEVESWGIPLDIRVDGDNVVVTASVPGLDPEKIDVTVEDQVLTLKAETESESEEQKDNYVLRERRTGSFYRAVRLPDSVDTEKAETSYKDGVLKLSFPKEASRKAKKLAIKAG